MRKLFAALPQIAPAVYMMGVVSKAANYQTLLLKSFMALPHNQKHLVSMITSPYEKEAWEGCEIMLRPYDIVSIGSGDSHLVVLFNRSSKNDIGIYWKQRFKSSCWTYQICRFLSSCWSIGPFGAVRNKDSNRPIAPMLLDSLQLAISTSP